MRDSPYQKNATTIYYLQFTGTNIMYYYKTKSLAKKKLQNNILMPYWHTYLDLSVASTDHALFLSAFYFLCFFILQLVSSTHSHSTRLEIKLCNY